VCTRQGSRLATATGGVVTLQSVARSSAWCDGAVSPVAPERCSSTKAVEMCPAANAGWSSVCCKKATFVVTPRIAKRRSASRPRASASSSIILSKSLRRTCQVPASTRAPSEPRAMTGTKNEFFPLGPYTLTPYFTG